MKNERIELTKSELSEIVKAANAPSPTVFEKVLLRGFKMPGENVRKISQMFKVAQEIVAAIGTLTGAYTTIKSALELTGILKPDDPFKEAKALIEGLILDLKDYYQDEEDEQKIDRRLGWAQAVSNAAAALAALNNSRSPSSFDQAVQKFNALADALFEMLECAWVNDLNADVPAAGSITLAQTIYGFPPPGVEYPPMHWMFYAQPSCMTTTGGSIAPRPIQYNSKADNLKRRIWDPSYYLDIINSGVAYFTTLLIAIEPAFRATAHERFRVARLAKQLADFVAVWQGSLFITNINAFLPPVYFNDRSSFFHPFASELQPLETCGMPFGVVDPVSGLAAFTPVWNEGFVYTVGGPNAGAAEVVVTNTTEARNIALDVLHDAVKGMEVVCGIAALRLLQARVAELASYGLTGSLFTQIERVKKAPPALSQEQALLLLLPSPGLTQQEQAVLPVPTDQEQAALWPLLISAVELIDLGEIGVKAGKPGKKYKAMRFFDRNIFTFRLPMVRRMDASRIQLGYRLEVSTESLQVSAESAQANSARLVLCKYDAPTVPSQAHTLPLFPTDPKSVELTTDTGVLYDVLQSAHLTQDDEERFERGEFNALRQRLFINPRLGRVSVRFDVTFELHLDHLDQAWIGYANVAVLNLDPHARDGFILRITVFEEANIAYDTYTGVPFEARKEIVADQMTLHMVPSYLLAEPDYFSDRLAGLMIIDKSIRQIRQTFDLIPKPWERGGEAMWRVRDLAHAEALKVQAFTEFERKNPELAASVVARFQPPAVVER